jgi:NAD(P)-dependent dehydrogenase (short-subunit alcohol dehydrogenase family)
MIEILRYGEGMQNKLQTEGYVGPFSSGNDELLQAMKSELNKLGNNFKNLHIKSEICQSLLSSPLIADFVSAYFGKSLKLWRTNCFKKVNGSGEVSWHHDRHFENADAKVTFSNLGNHFSILLAVTDMTEETGIMEFIPGSHLPVPGFKRDERPFHQRAIQEHFLDIPEELLAKRVSIPLKRGEFILFHSGLLHRSLPAQGVDVNRYSMVARLCTADTLIPNELASPQEVVDYPMKMVAQNGSLDGKVALITGGSRGIGRAIAKAILAQGGKVMIVGRDNAKLAQAQSELNQSGQASALGSLQADASDYASLSQAFELAHETFGKIDIVFSNAATNQPAGVLENMTVDEWMTPFNSNMACTVNTCKLAVQYLRQSGGNIITLGSGIGHAGAQGNSSYAAAKAASWVFTKSLAQEVAKYKINVNELIPGPVKTDMNPNANGAHWKEPDDIGPLAIMLATQDLENGATGQCFCLKRF